MNTYKVFIIIIIISSALSSCTDPFAKVISLEEEVIEIHDEVMPKTSTIHQLKKDLRSSLALSQDSTLVFDLIKKLSNADDQMRIWMDEYVGSDEDKSVEDNMKNLEVQKTKMIKVKDLMLTAISNAQDQLKSNAND